MTEKEVEVLIAALTDAITAGVREAVFHATVARRDDVQSRENARQSIEHVVREALKAHAAALKAR